MSHDDHGHEHGHHGPDTKTPVVIGAVVIIGLIVGLYSLVKAGTKARSEGRANLVTKVDAPPSAHKAHGDHGQAAHGDHGQAAHGKPTPDHARAGHAGHKPAARDHAGHKHAARGHAGHEHAGHKHGGAVPREAAGRAAFAIMFSRRQQAQGFKLTAKTAGPKHDVFIISWAGQAEKGKVEALKKATPFHAAARARGFSRLIIREGGKQVFDKNLVH